MNLFEQQCAGLGNYEYRSYRPAPAPPQDAVEYARSRAQILKATISGAETKLAAEKAELEQIEKMLAALDASGQ